MTWEQKLWDLLCALYKSLGGDCKDLPPRPADPSQIPSVLVEAIEDLEARFQSVGTPVFVNQVQRDAYLALLAEIEAHLSEAGNTLPTGSNTQLHNLIDSMQAAVP